VSEARILERDLEALGFGGELGERAGRRLHLGLVVDESEVAEIDRREVGVGPGGGQGELVEGEAVRREQARCGGPRRLNEVSRPSTMVGGRCRAFELDTAECADRGVRGDEIDRASAGLLEAGL